MKNLVILTVATAFALQIAGCTKKEAPVETPPAQAEVKADHVAIVNGAKVDRSVYEAELAKVTQNGLRKIPEVRLKKISDNIVNRLIDEKLLTQEVKKNGIVVTPEEIDTQYNIYKARFKGDEQFGNYLKHGKVTPEIIKKRLTRSYSLTKLLEKLGKLEVTDEDISNAYTVGIKMFTEPEQVHSAHILVRLNEKDDEARTVTATKKINKALKRLKKGEDFGAVAKEMSEDATTSPKNGDLGFFKTGMMVPAFEKAAFALKPGQYTKTTVTTPFGLHLIKTFERKAERVRPLEEVREKIVSSLRNKAIFKARRNLVRQLRSAAQIEKLEGDISTTGVDPAAQSVTAPMKQAQEPRKEIAEKPAQKAAPAEQGK